MIDEDKNRSGYFFASQFSSIQTEDTTLADPIFHGAWRMSLNELLSEYFQFRLECFMEMDSGEELEFDRPVWVALNRLGLCQGELPDWVLVQIKGIGPLDSLVDATEDFQVWVKGFKPIDP